MSHPDEGTIQALLDGELDPADRRRVESHAAGCAACRARIAEARAFLVEADRLVEVLAVPTRGASQPARRRPRPSIRALAWAASIVFAVGLGYLGRGATNRQPELRPESGQPSESVPSSPGPALTTPAVVTPGAPAPVTDERQRVAEEPKRTAAPATRGAAREDQAPSGAAAPAANAMPSKALPEEAERTGNLPVEGWRVIALEEAVRILGGQVRLIDGLAPERVESGPGTAVVGADPTAPVVRVVYASGTIVLDEQRAAAAVTAGRMEAADAAPKAAPATLGGWRGDGTIRYAVTGSVPPDSLRTLAARVR